MATLGQSSASPFTRKKPTPSYTVRLTPGGPQSVPVTSPFAKGSGGGSSSSSGGSSPPPQSPAPAPVYTSTLLQQSFASEAARASAEQSYRAEQSRQQQAQQQQARQQLIIQSQAAQNQTSQARGSNLPAQFVGRQPTPTQPFRRTPTQTVEQKENIRTRIKNRLQTLDKKSKENIQTVEQREALIQFETTASYKDIISTTGIPGVVRGTFYKGGNIAEAVATKAGVPFSGRVFGETLLFGTLLAPVSTTTAQYQRELAEVSRVGLKGVTQEIGKEGTVTTKGEFIVQRAGKTKSGIFTSESTPKIVDRSFKDVSGLTVTRKQPVIETTLRGIVRGKKLDVTPLSYTKPGQVVDTTKQVFGAKEIATIKPLTKAQMTRLNIPSGVGKVYVTTSRGVAKTVGEKGFTQYSSTGFSQFFKQGGKQFVGQVGTTRAGTQDAVSVGVFRVLKPGRGIDIVDTKTLTGSGQVSTKQISKILSGLTQSQATTTKGVIQGAVKISPETKLSSVFTSITPTKLVSDVISKPRTTMVTKTKTTPRVTTKVTQIQDSVVNTKQLGNVLTTTIERSGTRTGVRTRQLPIVDTRESQLPISKTKQLPITDMRQQQRLKQVPLLRTRTLQRPIGITTPMIRIPIPKVPFGGAFRSRGKRLDGMGGLFKVFGRRRGSFKVIGVGRTEKEALSYGKDWASKTLGVTFKVPGVSEKKIKGFKTKKTKEGVLYVEKIGRRLKKKGTEVKEIQLYKGLKGGKR